MSGRETSRPLPVQTGVSLTKVGVSTLGGGGPSTLKGIFWFPDSTRFFLLNYLTQEKGTVKSNHPSGSPNPGSSLDLSLLTRVNIRHTSSRRRKVSIQVGP